MNNYYFVAFGENVKVCNGLTQALSKFKYDTSANITISVITLAACEIAYSPGNDSIYTVFIQRSCTCNIFGRSAETAYAVT